MTENTDYKIQANLLVDAYRRLGNMVQQTRTDEVKKTRAMLKKKIEERGKWASDGLTVKVSLLLF